MSGESDTGFLLIFIPESDLCAFPSRSPENYRPAGPRGGLYGHSGAGQEREDSELKLGLFHEDLGSRGSPDG